MSIMLVSIVIRMEHACDHNCRMEDAYGTLFVSLPSLLDPSLAPPGKHIVHAFSPDWIDSWQVRLGACQAGHCQGTEWTACTLSKAHNFKCGSLASFACSI